MKTVDQGKKLIALADSLAELHEWELTHMPMMQTMTGRNLYFMIIQLALDANGDGDKALKEVFSSNHFTARAMRTRMQSMRNEGLLDLVPAPDDGRIKHLMPTAKFYESVSAHTEQLRRLLERSFIVLNK